MGFVILALAFRSAFDKGKLGLLMQNTEAESHD